MKYYDESEMKALREIFEKEVLQWPEITTKKMFGCPCYKANDKLFAFLVTGGIVLTRLSDAERNKISKRYKSTPFQAGKKTMKAWVQTPVKEIEDLSEMMPYVKKSYKAALKE